MGVGSYIFTLQEREMLNRGNPKMANVAILKLLGEHPLPMGDIRAETGLPADTLQRALEELVSDKLIALDQNGKVYQLTDRGEKARFLVAS